MNCLICDEKFNKTKHTLVSCLYCGFGACKECCKTYIVDQPQPKCMGASCGKTWTRRFLLDNFPNSFLQGEWRKSREKIAFDRETAQLPAAQEVMERRKRIENARGALQRVLAQLRDLTKHYTKEYKKEKKTFLPGSLDVPADFSALRLRKEQLELILNHRINHTGTGTHGTVTHFVRACPAEECRGFLSSEWKCGLCKTETCSKCHIIKSSVGGAEHTCNPDDVETAKLLAKDTKPCPKCHTGIFKIDGCDQMWCTQCHTAFSWRTGALEHHIHNPHYYEWQRRTNGGIAPRVPGDNPGGGCGPNEGEVQLTHQLFREFLRHSDPLAGTNLLPVIENIIRDTLHLRYYDLPTFQPNPIDDQHSLETRIRYLSKAIDKASFVRTVQKAAKRRELDQEISQILQMFVQVVTDTMHRCFSVVRQLKMDDAVGVARVADILQEVETLRVYVNERLKDVFSTYKYKVREIAHMNDQVLHRPYQGVFVTL